MLWIYVCFGLSEKEKSTVVKVVPLGPARPFVVSFQPICDRFKNGFGTLPGLDRPHQLRRHSAKGDGGRWEAVSCSERNCKLWELCTLRFYQIFCSWFHILCLFCSPDDSVPSSVSSVNGQEYQNWIQVAGNPRRRPQRWRCLRCWPGWGAALVPRIVTSVWSPASPHRRIAWSEVRAAKASPRSWKTSFTAGSMTTPPWRSWTPAWIVRQQLATGWTDL